MSSSKPDKEVSTYFLQTKTLRKLSSDYNIIQEEQPEFVQTYHNESNMLEIYFMIKGASDSDYAGGFYIGKIEHNKDYPFKAPDYYMYTPNGRFDTGEKLCTTNSSFHQDNWSPAWGLSTLLHGFVAFMLSDAEENIVAKGGIRPVNKAARVKFAKNSFEFNKKNYPNIMKHFTRFVLVEGDNIIRMRTESEIETERKAALARNAELKQDAKK